MARSGRMDQFTFDHMIGNLRKDQFKFVRRLDAIELLRQMGDTLTESTVGTITTAYNSRSPDEGMDKFLEHVKKKKSAMERLRDILRSSPEYHDLADMLEAGIGARPRTMPYYTTPAPRVPPAAPSQRPPTVMTSTSRRQTTRAQKPTGDTKLVDLSHRVFAILSEHLQVATPYVAGMDRSWKALAGKLNFSQSEVNRIGDVNDPVDYFFNVWIQHDGENCTLGKLVSLLQEIKRLDVIDEIKSCTGYQHESQSRDGTQTNSREMPSPPTQHSSTSSGGPDVPQAIDRMLGHVEHTTELANQTQRNIEDVGSKKDAIVSVEAEEAEHKSRPFTRSRSREGSRSKESSRSSVKDTVVNAVAMEADNKLRISSTKGSTVSFTARQPEQTGPMPAQESEEPGSFHPDLSNESPLQVAQRQEAKELRAMSRENVLEPVRGQPTMVESSARAGYSNVSMTRSIDDNDDDSIKMVSLPSSVCDDSNVTQTEQQSADNDIEKGMLENVRRDKTEKSKINQSISSSLRGSRENREQGQANESNSSRQLVSAQDSGNSRFSLDTSENEQQNEHVQTQIKTVYDDDSSSNDAQSHPGVPCDYAGSHVESRDRLRPTSGNVSNQSVRISGQVESEGQVNSGATQSRTNEPSEWSALTNFERFTRIREEIEANQNGSLEVSSTDDRSDVISNNKSVTQEENGQSSTQNDVSANVSVPSDCRLEQTDAESLGVEVDIAVVEGGSKSCSESQKLSRGVVSASSQHNVDQTVAKSLGVEVGIAGVEGGPKSCSESQILSSNVVSASSRRCADQTVAKSLGVEVGITGVEGGSKSCSESQKLSKGVVSASSQGPKSCSESQILSSSVVSASSQPSADQTVAKSLGVEVGIAGVEGGPKSCSESQILSSTSSVVSASSQRSADQTGVESVGVEVGIAGVEGGPKSCSESQILSSTSSVVSASRQRSADQTGVESVGMEIGIAGADKSLESSSEHPEVPEQIVTGGVDTESKSLPNPLELIREVENRESLDPELGISFGLSVLEKCGRIQPVFKVEELADLEEAKQAGLVQDVSHSDKHITYCGEEDCSLHKISAREPVEEVEVGVDEKDGEREEDKRGELKALSDNPEKLESCGSEYEELETSIAKTDDNSSDTQSENESNSMSGPNSHADVVGPECKGDACKSSDNFSSAVVSGAVAYLNGAGEVEPEPEQLIRNTMHLKQDSRSGHSKSEPVIGVKCDDEQILTFVADRGACSAPTSMTDEVLGSVQGSQFSSMPTRGVELFASSAQGTVPQFNTNNNSRRQTDAIRELQNIPDNNSPVISESSKHFQSKELGGQVANELQETSYPGLAQSCENVSQNNDTSDTVSQHSMTLEHGADLTKPAQKKCAKIDSYGPKCVSEDSCTSVVLEAGISLSASLGSEIDKASDSDQVMQPNSLVRRSESVTYQDSVEELEQGFEPELHQSCENVVTIGRVEVIQNLPVRKARISRVQFDTDDESLTLDEEALKRHLQVDFIGGLGHTFRSTEDVHYGPKNTASVLEINKTNEMKRSASCDNIAPVARKRFQRIPSKEEGDSVGCFPKKLSFLGCCTRGRLPKFTSKPFRQSDIYKKWMSFSGQKEGRKSRTASESDKGTVDSNMSTPNPDVHLKKPVYSNSNETLELDADRSLVGDSGLGTSKNTMLSASRTLSDYSEDVSSTADLNATPTTRRKQRSLMEIFDSLPDGSNPRHIDTTQGWDIVWQNGTPVGSLTCLSDEHLYKQKKKSAGKKGGKSDRPKKSKKQCADELIYSANPDLESSGSYNELNGSDSEEIGRDRCFSLDTWISNDIEASLSGIEEITSPSSAFPQKPSKTGRVSTLSFDTESKERRRKSSSDAPKNAPIRFLRVVTSTPVKGNPDKPNTNADVGQKRRNGKQGQKGTLKPLVPSPENIRSRQPVSSPSSSHSGSAKFLYDHWSPSPSRSSSEISPAENRKSLGQETSSFNQHMPSPGNLVPGMTSYIHNIEKTVVDLTNGSFSYQQNQPDKLQTPSSPQTDLRRMSAGESPSRKSSLSGNQGTESRRDSKSGQRDLNQESVDKEHVVRSSARTLLTDNPGIVTIGTRHTTANPSKGIVSRPLDDKAIAAGSSYTSKKSSSPASARKHTDFGETIVTHLVMPDSNAMGNVSPTRQRSLRTSRTPPGQRRNPPSQQRPWNQNIAVEFGVTPNIIPTTQIVSSPAIAVKMETVSEMTGDLTVSSANSATRGSSGSGNQPSSPSTSTSTLQLGLENSDTGSRETSQRNFVGQSAAKMAFLSGNTVRDPTNGNKYFYRFKNHSTNSIAGETKPFQGDSLSCDIQDDRISGEIDSSSELLSSESTTTSQHTPNVSSAPDRSTGAHEKGRRNSDSSVPPLGLQRAPQASHLEGAVGGRNPSVLSSNQMNQTGAEGKGSWKSFGADQKRGNLRTSQSVDGATGGQSRVFDIGIGALRCAMTPAGIDIGLKLSSPSIRRHVLGEPSEGAETSLQISNRDNTGSGVKETDRGSTSEQGKSVKAQTQEDIVRPTLRIEGTTSPNIGTDSRLGQSELRNIGNVGSLEEALPATEVVPDQPLALCSHPPVIRQPTNMTNSSHDIASQSHIVIAPSFHASDTTAPAPAPRVAVNDLNLFAVTPSQQATANDLDLSKPVLAPQVAANNLDLITHVPLNSTHAPDPKSAANDLNLRASAACPGRTLDKPRTDSAQGGDENNNVDEKRRKQSPESERMQELLEFRETIKEENKNDDQMIHEDDQVVYSNETPRMQAPESKAEVGKETDAALAFGKMADVVDRGNVADLPVISEMEHGVQAGTSTDFVIEEAMENEVHVNTRTDVGLPVVAETEAVIENVAIIDNMTEKAIDDVIEIDKKVDNLVTVEAQPVVETAKATSVTEENLGSAVEIFLKADGPVVAETDPGILIEASADIGTEEVVNLIDSPVMTEMPSDFQDANFIIVTEDTPENEVELEADVALITESNPDHETIERADSVTEDTVTMENLEMVNPRDDSPFIAVTEPNIETEARAEETPEEIDSKSAVPVAAAPESNFEAEAMADAEETREDSFETDSESDSPVIAATEPNFKTEARADAEETVEERYDIESKSAPPVTVGMKPNINTEARAQSEVTVEERVDIESKSAPPVTVGMKTNINTEARAHAEETVEDIIEIDNESATPVIAATEANMKTKTRSDTEEIIEDRVELDSESPVIAATESNVKTEARADEEETVEERVGIDNESVAPVIAATESSVKTEARADAEETVEMAAAHSEPLAEMKARQAKAFEDSGIGLDDSTSGATGLEAEVNLDLGSSSSGSLPDILNLTKSGSFEEGPLGDDDVARRSLPDVVVYAGGVADSCEIIPASELLEQSSKLSFERYLEGAAEAETKESDLPDGGASTSTTGKVTASSEPGDSQHVSSQDAHLADNALTSKAWNSDNLELSRPNSITQSSIEGVLSSVVLSPQATTQEMSVQNGSTETHKSTDIRTSSGDHDTNINAQAISMESLNGSLFQSPAQLSAEIPQDVSSVDIREETYQWDSLPVDRGVGSTPTQSGSLNFNPPTISRIKLPQFVSLTTRNRNNEAIQGREGSIEKQVGRVEKESNKAQEEDDEITGDMQQTTPSALLAGTVPEHSAGHSLYREQTSSDTTMHLNVNTQITTENSVTSTSYSDEIGPILEGNRSYHQQDLSRPTLQQGMIKIQQEYGSYTDSRKDDLGPTLSHYREQEDSMTSHSAHTHQRTFQLQNAPSEGLLRDDSGPVLQGSYHYPQQDSVNSHSPQLSNHQETLDLHTGNVPNLGSSRDDSGPVLQGACYYPQQNSNSHSPKLSTHRETLEFQNASSVESSTDNSGPVLQGACHYQQQSDPEFTSPSQDQVMNFAQFQEIVSQLDETSQYNIPNIQAELQTLDDDAYEICSIIVDEIFNKAMAYIEDREMRIFSAFGMAQHSQSRVFTAAGTVRGSSIARGIMLPGGESRLMPPVGEIELDGVETEEAVAVGGAGELVEGATSGEVEPLDEKGLIKKSVDICKKFAPYAAGSATFGTLAYLMYKKLKTM